MAKRISDSNEAEIFSKIRTALGDSPAEKCLYGILQRYAPQMNYWEEKEFSDFINYQRAIYVDGAAPEIGRIITCLNPSFVGGMKAIQFSSKDAEVYTRASLKENGYRVQLHVGNDKPLAYTRQFTRYELRLFPELEKELSILPVMIGDAELINASYEHLAGFHRLDKRIPDQRYWPRKNEKELDDVFLQTFFTEQDGKIFDNGYPKQEFLCTLAFHGLFAIAKPETWGKSKNIQKKNVTSFCELPIDYKTMDKILTTLADYLQKKGSALRVVEQKVVSNKSEIEQYYKEKEQHNLEGICVMQTGFRKNGKRSFDFAKSYKIKRYETVDSALLGIYLKKPKEGLSENNIEAALLGLYDLSMNKYLPFCRVNLNPEGKQIKINEQRDRLINLREELFTIVSRHGFNKNELNQDEQKETQQQQKIQTLLDVFLFQGATFLKHLLKDETIFEKIYTFYKELPRGLDLLSAIIEYKLHQKEYAEENFARLQNSYKGKKMPKRTNKTEQFFYQQQDFLESIVFESELNKESKRRIISYFKKEKEVKTASKKLMIPQIVLDIQNPFIIETQVFDITLGLNQFPAGFHSWYCNSFKVNNVFAERVRHDKSTTTDYETIYEIALRNTGKKILKK